MKENAPKELEVMKPVAASDDAVVKAYVAAQEAENELVQSPLFKSFTRRAVISGLMLLEKKAEVGHGNWIAWMQKNGVEQRTAQRHMEGGTSWCGLLQIRHDVVFDGLPVSQVLTLPAATLPEAAKPVREKGDAIIETKTIREINVAFEDVDAARKPKGGARKIHFTCPHCSTRNTGIIGREITCVKCKKKIAVKPDVDPEAETKRKAEAINDNAQEIVAAVVTLREASADDGALLTAESYIRLLNESKWLTKFLAQAKKLRAKRAAKSTKEGK